MNDKKIARVPTSETGDNSSAIAICKDNKLNKTTQEVKRRKRIKQKPVLVFHQPLTKQFRHGKII